MSSLSPSQAHTPYTVLRREDKGRGTLYLFGHLSKVADKPQDGVSDQGVTDTAEVYFVAIEVGMEGIHSLHCGLSLLLVPKNEVYPVVEVGTDKVTFQSLETKSKEHEKCRPLKDVCSRCTDQERHVVQDAGSAQDTRDVSLRLVSSDGADVQATQGPSNSCLQLVAKHNSPFPPTQLIPPQRNHEDPNIYVMQVWGVIAKWKRPD